MSRRWRPCAFLTVALSSAAFLGPRPFAWAQGQPPSSCEENVRRLQAEGTERLRQLEALRAAFAASEKAWKENQALLDSMRKQLRDELAARQASDERKDGELAHAGEALRAAKGAEAAQSARVAELDQAIGELRRQADLQRAERQKLESEVASLRRAESEAIRSHAAALAARDAEVKRLAERLAQVEREQAGRANVKELERALVEERHASQRKLETLESVLKNTRSAGADLRTQLDGARDKNAALSRQVEELEAAARKVHELRARYRDESSHLEDLAQTTDTDVAEIQALQSQQSSLAAEIHRARSEHVAIAADVSRSMKTEEPLPAPVARQAGAGDEDRSDGDLREQLSLERERRETLENEVKRLTASGESEERFVEVWKALQSARSEILVLTNQLADERHDRESLEVALTHMKEASGAQEQSTAEFAARLAETLKERREEADRLAEQLKSANEAIVSLKGRLEAAGSQATEGNPLADVDQENQKLREALRTAEEANRSLRDKAELATRLAEIVYGKTR